MKLVSAENLGIILVGFSLGILSRNSFFFIIFLPIVIYHTKKANLLSYKTILIIFVFCCGLVIPSISSGLRSEVGQVVYITQKKAYLSSPRQNSWVFYKKGLKLGQKYKFKISKNRRIYSYKPLEKGSLFFWQKLRIKISKKLKNYPLFLAFFIGDNSRISSKLARSIQKQGIWSAFLTSSIQINCVFSLLSVIFRWIFALDRKVNYKVPRRNLRNFLVISLSFFYYLLTLGGYGSLRVLFVRSLSLFFPNQKRRLSIIFALLILIMNPRAIFDYGFQLSLCISFLASERFYCDPMIALWFGKFAPLGFLYFILMKYLAPVMFFLSLVIVFGLNWQIFGKLHGYLAQFLSLPNPLLIKLPQKFLLIPACFLLISYFFKKNRRYIYVLYVIIFITIISKIRL
jgi:hypothetical protein